MAELVGFSGDAAVFVIRRGDERAVVEGRAVDAAVVVVASERVMAEGIFNGDLSAVFVVGVLRFKRFATGGLKAVVLEFAKVFVKLFQICIIGGFFHNILDTFAELKRHQNLQPSVLPGFDSLGCIEFEIDPSVAN